MTAAIPTPVESIERLIAAMPLADTLRLIQRVTNHEKFGECDYVYTQQLDVALAALAERADNGEYDVASALREEAADRGWFEQVAA